MTLLRTSVSHDVTVIDWLSVLTGRALVISTPSEDPGMKQIGFVCACFTSLSRPGSVCWGEEGGGGGGETD